MIKIFRKLRHKLLVQNKFTRYLLYAIGEIILVVIGILLALEINNRNELKKNENATELVLKEIQNNLLEDIKLAQENLNNYLDYYSIAKKIFDFENPWNNEDYRNGKVKKIGNLYVDFVINKNGYENLKGQLDKLPEKYKPILYDLKELYVDLNETIRVHNERIRSTVYKHIDFMNSQNWDIHRFKYSQISKEEMDYFLFDDAYKRNVLKYMNDRNNVFKFCHRYRIKAIDTYVKIDSMLKENNVEKHYNLLGKIKSKTDIEKYLGTYKLADSSIPISIVFFYRNHNLFTQDDINGTLKHYQISDKRYFYMDPTIDKGYPIVWEFNINNEGANGVRFLNDESSSINLVKLK